MFIADVFITDRPP